MVIKHFVALAALAALLSSISLSRADGGQDGITPAGGQVVGRNVVSPNSAASRDGTGDDSAESPEDESSTDENSAVSGKQQSASPDIQQPLTSGGSAGKRPTERAGKDDAQLEADFQQIQRDCANRKYAKAEKDLDLLIKHHKEFLDRRAPAQSKAGAAPAAKPDPAGSREKQQ